jgi:outer membrane protease
VGKYLLFSIIFVTCSFLSASVLSSTQYQDDPVLSRQVLISAALDEAEEKFAPEEEPTNVDYLLWNEGSLEKGTFIERFKRFWGEHIVFDLGLDTGYLQGTTHYTIDFVNAQVFGGKGRSRLEFPFDNAVAGITTKLAYRPPVSLRQDRARLCLNWKTNITDKTGRFRDSDWVENDPAFLNSLYDLADDGLRNFSAAAPYATWNNPGKDIYSESDLEIDKYYTIDINYVYNFFPTDSFSIGPMAGYWRREVEFTASNTRQIGFGPYDTDFTMFVPGKTIEYESEQDFPYLGLSADYFWQESLEFNARFGYSCWAQIDDIDRHVARDISSKGSAKGDAYIAACDGAWQFKPDWWFRLSGEYLEIETDGTQAQSGGGAPHDRIVARNWQALTSVNYRF